MNTAAVHNSKLEKYINPIQSQNSAVTETQKSHSYIDIIHERIPLRIYFKNILYADTFRNAVYIHTDVGVLKNYITFEKFKKSLSQDERFVHCYKGCIVNMDRAKKIAEDDFIMDNGERVQIRKRGGSAVKKTYLQYILSKDIF